MKKQLLTALSVLLAAGSVKAQDPFATKDSININNINASVLVHGDMWYDPDLNGLPVIRNHCLFTTASNIFINKVGGLWMSAYDATGQLHASAQTYRDGIDYWPGPLDDNGMLPYATSYKWAKIWKVNRTEIQAFQAATAHNEDNTPAAILTWPAKGNVNAAGNGGYHLDITRDMAPFVDLNGNGIYEPLSGEYPDVKGDQALWWIFSDNGPTHNQSNGVPIRVELHAMAYAYKRNTSIDDIVYYDYTVVNRSSNAYNHFRLGIFDDVFISNTWSGDLIGFDSVHRMGIGFAPDDTDGAVCGMSIVESPGDAGGSYQPAGCFNSFQMDDTAYFGIPGNDREFSYVMRSRGRAGVHISNIFNGPGIPCNNDNIGPDCNYLFPGDPADPNTWSACSCASNYFGNLFVLSTGDFNLAPGASQHMALAMMAKTHAGNCGKISFAGIKALADTAWNIYHNPLTPLQVGTEYAANNKPAIYPNPAHDQLFIADKNAGNGAEAIAIYNTSGQKMNITFDKNGNGYAVDISRLPSGIYHVVYTGAAAQNAATFIKE